MIAITARIGAGTGGRTKQEASHMERDISSFPPTSLSAVTSPRHHRSPPPRAAESALRGSIATTTCVKASLAVPQHDRPLSDKLYDISVRRRQHQQQLRQLQQLQQQQQQQQLQREYMTKYMTELGIKYMTCCPRRSQPMTTPTQSILRPIRRRRLQRKQRGQHHPVLQDHRSQPAESPQRMSPSIGLLMTVLRTRSAAKYSLVQ